MKSIKDDKSILLDDLLSRKTYGGTSNIENELKVILQPEFINSISLSKNGEVVSPELSNHKPKKQSRLERRIECQTTRVVKPAITSPQQKQAL